MKVTQTHMSAAKYFTPLLLAILSGSALALDIPESVVARALSEKFPITKGEFELREPKLTLLAGNAQLCATAKPKAMKSGIDFCASFIPKWKKESGTLHISSLNLTSIKVPGVADGELDWTKKLVNRALLPHLDDFQIYKSDGFIAKQVSSVKIKLGYLDISFW